MAYTSEPRYRTARIYAAASSPMAYHANRGRRGQKYDPGIVVPPYSFSFEMQRNIDVPYFQKRKDYRGN